jgi:hypothetical protein
LTEKLHHGFETKRDESSIISFLNGISYGTHDLTETEKRVGGVIDILKISESESLIIKHGFDNFCFYFKTILFEKFI